MYNVDDDCCEDGFWDSFIIFRIFDVVDEFFVVIVVEIIDDVENDDVKGGDDCVVCLGIDG